MTSNQHEIVDDSPTRNMIEVESTTPSENSIQDKKRRVYGSVISSTTTSKQQNATATLPVGGADLTLERLLVETTEPEKGNEEPAVLTQSSLFGEEEDEHGNDTICHKLDDDNEELDTHEEEDGHCDDTFDESEDLVLDDCDGELLEPDAPSRGRTKMQPPPSRENNVVHSNADTEKGDENTGDDTRKENEPESNETSEENIELTQEEELNDTGDESKAIIELNEQAVDPITTEEKQEENSSKDDETPLDNEIKEDDAQDNENNGMPFTQDNENNVALDSMPNPEETIAPNYTLSQVQKQPNKQDLLAAVDDLFKTITDFQSVTVGDVLRSLSDTFQVKLRKSRKMLVKARLQENIDAKEEEAKLEQKKKRTEQAEKTVDSLDTDASGTDDDAAVESESNSSSEEEEEDEDSASVHKTRSKSPQKRKPSHLKIHHQMLRKRQLAEAKVRTEELEAEQVQKINEEDRRRAELIAKRFDTDSEKARIQRIEDRMILLDRLEEKRMILLSESDQTKKSSAGIEEEEKKDPEVQMGSVEKGQADSGEEEDSDEEELELVGAKDLMNTQKSPESSLKSNPLDSLNISTTLKKASPRETHTTSPKSIFDFFGANCPKDSASSGNKRKKDNQQLANPRMSLRNALRAKQFENGNRWLARELGYNNTEDHIRDCQTVETKKKKMLLKKEVERRRVTQERNNHLKAIVSGEFKTDQTTYVEEEIKESILRTVVNEDELSETGKEEEEEDEELVMAREIEYEQQQSKGEVANNNEAGSQANCPHSEGKLAQNQQTDVDVCSGNVGSGDTTEDDVEMDEQHTRLQKDEKQATQDESLKSNSNNAIESDDIYVQDDIESGEQHNRLNKDEKEVTQNESFNSNKNNDIESDDVYVHDVKINTDTHSVTSTPVDNEEETEFDESLKTESKEVREEIEEHNVKEKKPRNAAWKALLQKESQMIKRQKADRGGGALVELEAEEEEEEEGVTGLEDFGFTLNTKKDGDDDDDDIRNNANEDDFENIVDDISDNEGDEEAGEVGRKALAAQEETNRHKEMMRRMREGYDGRRGGIAGGGGGARGNHRFDQLVAADNRDDARRLGLLNDDELDSDDENAGVRETGDNEVEDESTLLDKVLKDRFLNRPQLPDENFSDADEDSTHEEEAGNGSNEEDEEDRKEERIAKRFAKRARMNRLLEAHNDESQHSRVLSLDDDQGLKKELKSIRNVFCKRKRQTSGSSSLSSNSRGAWGRNASLIPQPAVKEQSNTNSIVGDSGSNNTAIGSRLSIGLLALNHQNNSRKRKTSFLGGSRSIEAGSALRSKNTSAVEGKGFNLGHVVFHATEDKKREMKRSRSLPSPATNNIQSCSISLTRSSSHTRGKNSLWSKVSANSFRRR